MSRMLRLTTLPKAVVTRATLFHFRPPGDKRRSGTWRWRWIILKLIDGSGGLCLSGHGNNFALTKMSGQSQETWMRNAENCKTVKAFA